MFEIYLITICTRLSLIAAIVGIGSAIVMIVSSLAYMIQDSNDDERKNFLRIFTVFRNWCIAAASLYILTPSQEQAVTIVSVGTVYDYCKNSEQIQQLPDNVVRTLNVVLTKFSDKYDSKEEK